MDEEKSDGIFKYKCDGCGQVKAYIEGLDTEFGKPMDLADGWIICPTCAIHNADAIIKTFCLSGGGRE